jgi:F0F1-type ATP synthase membrane subunit b/b'
MAKISVTMAALGLAFAAAAVVAKPVDNVSHTRHPNIAAAQHLSTQAYEKIVAAQKANEFDLGGHAQKAKDLLEQANHELKEAAETSNAHGH